LNEAVTNTIRWTAQSEGLFLDPVYTGKAMAGLIEMADQRCLGMRIGFRIRVSVFYCSVSLPSFSRKPAG
jgi:hypothetical protein